MHLVGEWDVLCRISRLDDLNSCLWGLLSKRSTFSLTENEGKKTAIDQMCTFNDCSEVENEFILLRNEFGLVINVRNELFDLITACTQEMPVSCVYALHTTVASVISALTKIFREATFCILDKLCTVGVMMLCSFSFSLHGPLKKRFGHSLHATLKSAVQRYHSNLCSRNPLSCILYIIRRRQVQGRLVINRTASSTLF